jgi:thiosulfate/3-mercaptopyruvate sulfurtransferase
MIIFNKYVLFILILFFNFNVVYANPLVDKDWLKDKICNDNIKIIEVHRSKKNYELAHIPCSIFTNFYLDGWRETRKKMPLLMPSRKDLEALIGSLGISSYDYVVIAAPGLGKYDMAEAAAIYFTFKYLGHKNISILSGGFKSWKNDWDNDIETGFFLPQEKTYKSEINNNIIANKEDVLKVINNNGYLIDARSSAMYMGINSSFPALRAGTIPEAINIPNNWLLINDSLFFHDKVNLEKIFEYSGIFRKDGQISFCNAGLESALSWFVMSEILEFPNNKLYESSLAEWSKDSSLPMIDIINFSKRKDNGKEIDSFSMKPPE